MVGSILGAGATAYGASVQADAVNNATDAQKEQFATITANNKPFLNTGTSALSRIAGMYGLDNGSGSGTPGTGTSAPQGVIPQLIGQMPGMQNGTQPAAPGSTSGTNDPYASFYQTPDYQFRFGQGIKGVDAGATARGMLDSGAARKAEIAYAGNLASGEYNSYANRLMDLAKVGQGAANNQATAGQSYAANIGNLGMAGANGTANAINGIAGQVQNATAGWNPFASSYGGATSPQNINSGYGIGNAGYQNTVQLPAGFK